jgi:hypothetical protein
MIKKLGLALFWMVFTTGIALASIPIAYKMDSGKSLSLHLPAIWQGDTEPATLAANNPDSPNPQIQVAPEVGDARVILVQNFLERHKSPILDEDPEFATFLVQLADTNNMDFRLLPAIAMQESNLCKVIPQDSHNCLGLGVHARGTWGFESYRENFTAAASILKKNYIDIGLTTTEEIERKYNPTSHNRDGSWASSVNQWMAEMRYDDRALGKELKTDANLLEFTEGAESSTPAATATKNATPKPTASPTGTTQTPEADS